LSWGPTGRPRQSHRRGPRRASFQVQSFRPGVRDALMNETELLGGRKKRSAFSRNLKLPAGQTCCRWRGQGPAGPDLRRPRVFYFPSTRAMTPAFGIANTLGRRFEDNLQSPSGHTIEEALRASPLLGPPADKWVAQRSPLTGFAQLSRPAERVRRLRFSMVGCDPGAAYAPTDNVQRRPTAKKKPKPVHYNPRDSAAGITRPMVGTQRCLRSGFQKRESGVCEAAMWHKRWQIFQNYFFPRRSNAMM